MHSEQDLPKQKPLRTAPTAAAVAAKALSQPSTKSATPSPSSEQSGPSMLDVQRLERLEQLWVTMVETYGHRWTSSFGESPTLDHAWARHLKGLTGRQIANGLSQLTGDWPPSATEFRELCLHIPGLPTEPEAWAQALTGTYTHEAVDIAAEATGKFDLQTARLNDKALREVFNRNYAIVRARAVMGKPLREEIPKGISHDGKTPMQVQAAYSHQQVRDLITAQNIPTDGKAARALLLARMGIRREKHA